MISKTVINAHYISVCEKNAQPLIELRFQCGELFIKVSPKSTHNNARCIVISTLGYSSNGLAHNALPLLSKHLEGKQNRTQPMTQGVVLIWLFFSFG